jgi:hypothetical protein
MLGAYGRNYGVLKGLTSNPRRPHGGQEPLAILPSDN